MLYLFIYLFFSILCAYISPHKSSVNFKVLAPNSTLVHVSNLFIYFVNWWCNVQPTPTALTPSSRHISVDILKPYVFYGNGFEGAACGVVTALYFSSFSVVGLQLSRSRVWYKAKSADAQIRSCSRCLWSENI